MNRAQCCRRVCKRIPNHRHPTSVDRTTALCQRMIQHYEWIGLKHFKDISAILVTPQKLRYLPHSSIPIREEKS